MSINLKPTPSTVRELGYHTPDEVSRERAWMARDPLPGHWYARYMVDLDRYLAILRRS